MARFRIRDLRTIENAPTSPGTLKNKLGEMLVSSINATARLDTVNPETGEYRIVLQGVLDQEESRFDDI